MGWGGRAPTLPALRCLAGQTASQGRCAAQHERQRQQQLHSPDCCAPPAPAPPRARRRSSLVEDTRGGSASRGFAQRLWPFDMRDGIPMNCTDGGGPYGAQRQACEAGEAYPGLWEVPCELRMAPMGVAGRRRAACIGKMAARLPSSRAGLRRQTGIEKGAEQPAVGYGACGVAAAAALPVRAVVASPSRVAACLLQCGAWGSWTGPSTWTQVRPCWLCWRGAASTRNGMSQLTWHALGPGGQGLLCSLQT